MVNFPRNVSLFSLEFVNAAADVSGRLNDFNNTCATPNGMRQAATGGWLSTLTPWTNRFQCRCLTSTKDSTDFLTLLLLDHFNQTVLPGGIDKCSGNGIYGPKIGIDMGFLMTFQCQFVRRCTNP